MRLKLNVRIGYLWTIIGYTRLAERGFASSFCGAVDRLCYLTMHSRRFSAYPGRSSARY